jgi:alpha-amylase
MDYETFGEHQQASTGIFDFLRHLPETVLSRTNITFDTPSGVCERHQPVAPLHVPFPVSWADEERDTSAWLGNDLQNEAFNKLYSVEKAVKELKDPVLLSDFRRLQESDHFYYMCTKFFSDGAVHSYFNPYDTPYEAFINYMNVVSDFLLRVERLKVKREDSGGTIIAVKEGSEKKDRVKPAEKEKPKRSYTKKKI